MRQRFNGAGDGNRTRTSSLEGYSSTIELLPPGRNFILQKTLVQGGELLRASCPWPFGPAFGCSKSLQAILSNLRLSSTSINLFRTTKHWWREVDSNHRRHEPADLQSAPVGRLGIPPEILENFKSIHICHRRHSPARLYSPLFLMTKALLRAEPRIVRAW